MTPGEHALPVMALIPAGTYGRDKICDEILVSIMNAADDAREEAVVPLQSVIARISTCHRCDPSQDSGSLDAILSEPVCVDAISAHKKAEAGA